MKFSKAFDNLSAIFSKSGLPVWPIDVYDGSKTDEPYGLVNFILSDNSVNAASVGGTVIVDIFISAGVGPRAAYSFADNLDQFLLHTSHDGTQFFSSTLVPRGASPDNPTKSIYEYSVTFKHFGAF